MYDTLTGTSLHVLFHKMIPFLLLLGVSWAADKLLPTTVSNWNPGAKILTFKVTGTTSGASANNRTYTISPTLDELSLTITWSEKPDNRGQHVREVVDNRNTQKSQNETEHTLDSCSMGNATWRFFRRLPEDAFWLMCDDEKFLSIPLADNTIKPSEYATVAMETLQGTYNLGKSRITTNNDDVRRL